MKSSVIKLSAVAAIALLLAALVLLLPAVSAEGAKAGLILCADVVIPSLFPFCVLALFCQKSGIMRLFARVLSPVSKRVFHLSGEQFCVFLMSFLAGYPVGMRLINELYTAEKISLERAKRMGLYCVNAGPAFIVSAIGEGLLRDASLGRLLLVSQAAATVVLAFIIELRQRADDDIKHGDNMRLGDAFVDSTASAAQSVFGICGWVVLFSALLSVINCGILPELLTKIISLTAEVTTAARYAGGNILLLSACLSFCGFSVHCQVYSVGKEAAPRYIPFLACRAMHAALSTGITYLLLRFDDRTVQTLSNGVETVRSNTSFTYASAAALIFMSVALIISVSDRKNYKIM